MASDRAGDSIVTVVTCEGNFSDPQFPYKLSSLVARLKRLLYTGDKPFRVTNVEPWNSVRVTFNIPREAAQRLRQLAQAGDRVLRDLGILSVQIEGDQVISLTIAGQFNEPQEIVLQTTDADGSRTSPQLSSSFNLPIDGSRASSNVDSGRKSVAQILAQQGSAESGSAVASATSTSLSISSSSSSSSSLSSLSSSSSTAVAAAASATVASGTASNAQESIFAGQLVASTDFKSPNVVAPKNEPIPFPPKITAPSSRSQTPFGPFPFASMTHAMNTMHGSQLMHSSQLNAVTQTPYQKFSFSPSPPYPPPPSPSSASGGGSGNSAFQSVKPPTLTSVQSTTTTTVVAAANTSCITSPTSTTVTTTSVVNHLQRTVTDRANAALTSPLLVNLLQSDMSSSGSQLAHTGGTAATVVTTGGATSGGKQSVPPGEGAKRKRKPRKSKEETIIVTSSDANSGSVRTSPGCSPRSNSNASSTLECTSTLSLFSQPFNLTPLSPPPPLTPPSASPPSLLGQPFVVTPDAMLKPSFGNSHHHHHHHHQIPTLPSPPPTAPSSSTSASNNSGQSSLEAEHELSPWPSPSKRTQHLINPFTGQLEPMSSDDDIDDAQEDARNAGAKDLTLFESNSGGSNSLSMSSNSSNSPMNFSETNTQTEQRSLRSGDVSECGEPKVREVLTGGKEGGGGGGESTQQQRTTHSCVSPVSSGGGSPSEKIKLRLKLDPTCDRQKTENAVAPNLQYKVDVSFVNIPTRRITSTGVVCESSGLVATSCSVATTQSSSCSTSPTTVTGNTSPCASSEPRVPPLHISLRGRNAAVVTSPRKEEKDWCSRLTTTNRSDYLSSTSTTTTSSATVVISGSTEVVASSTSKSPRARTSRISKDSPGKCVTSSSTSTVTDSSVTVAKSTLSSSAATTSLLGRRLSLSRGNGHSRRSRSGLNLASQINNDVTLNSPPALISMVVGRRSPTCETTNSSSVPDVKEKLPPSSPLSSPHQPSSSAREKTLLSGGSLVIDPSLNADKKSGVMSTVVTGVQLPKFEGNNESESVVSSTESCLASQRVTGSTVALPQPPPSSCDRENISLDVERERFLSMQSPDQVVSDSTNTRITREENLTTERVVCDDDLNAVSTNENTTQEETNGSETLNKPAVDELSALVSNSDNAEPVTNDNLPISVSDYPDGDALTLSKDSNVNSPPKTNDSVTMDVTTNQTLVPVAGKANPREALAVCEMELSAATASTTITTTTTTIVTSTTPSTTDSSSQPETAISSETETNEIVTEVTATVVVKPVSDDDKITSDESNLEPVLSKSVEERLSVCNDTRRIESFTDEVVKISKDLSENVLCQEMMEDESSQSIVADNVTVRSRSAFDSKPLILSTPKDVIVPSVQLALSPPMISSRVEVSTAAPVLTAQGKLRVASVALGSSNLSCLVTADGGGMLVEELPSLNTEDDGEGDVDFEATTNVATHHHHHRHHQISASSTTVLASINNDSPCSASPSGSSPDSLLTATGGEESGGDHGNGGICSGNSSGSGGSEQSDMKRNEDEGKGQHPSMQRRNYRGSGSPYEDSGVESMDATTEKSSGGESPCESGNGNDNNSVEHNDSEEKSCLNSDGGGNESAVDGEEKLEKADSISSPNDDLRDADGSNFPPEKESEILEESTTHVTEAEDNSTKENVEEEEEKEEDSSSGDVKSERLKEPTSHVDEQPSTEPAQVVQQSVSEVSEEEKIVEEDEKATSTTVEESTADESEKAADDDAENQKDEALVTEELVKSPVAKSPDHHPVEEKVETEEKKAEASDQEEEARVFLEGHSINGQSSLLASVVFGEQVMTVEDDLSCGSPSDATTTQLLVFTVEDGESIVVTEDAEHHMSLLRLTQADAEDQTSTLHFSTLETDEECGANAAENQNVAGETLNEDEKESISGVCEKAEPAPSEPDATLSRDELTVQPSNEVSSNESEPESSTIDSVSSLPLHSQSAKRKIDQSESLPQFSQMQPLSLPQISPILNCGNASNDDSSHTDTHLSSEPHRSLTLPIKFVAIPSFLNSHLTRQRATTTSNAIESTSSSSRSPTPLKMLFNQNSPTPDELNVMNDVPRRSSATPPLLKHHHYHSSSHSPKLRCVNDSIIFSPLASTSSMLTPLLSEESQSSLCNSNITDSNSVNPVTNQASTGSYNLYNPTIRRKLGYDDENSYDTDSSTSSMSNDLAGDYREQDDGEGDGCLMMGNTSVTSGDHNYIFRASSIPKRLRGSKTSQTPPPGNHSNSNSVELVESNSVPEDANGDLSTNESESMTQLSVEIPSDEPETERRSMRNTRSNSTLCSPNKGSSTAQSSPDSSHSNSHSRTMNDNDLEESDKVIEAIDGELRSLTTNRLSGKRKREESDSEDEKKGDSATADGVLLTLTSSVVLNADKEDRETTTNSTGHHMYTKPVKRKCSENAVELIKACIGVEDAPKRAATVKHQVVDGARHSLNRVVKSKEEITTKTKVGQYSTVTTSEGSSDDEVTLSELVTKTRAVKSKQVTGNADYPTVTSRNMTRNAKQKQNVKASASSGVIEEELGRISGPGGRGKNGRAVGTSRKESRKDAKEGGGASRVGNRGGRAQDKPNNKKLKEQNDCSTSPALGASALPAHTSAQNKPSSEEGVVGKRKLRSSGTSGYYNSLPRKRRRFSRDNR